MSGQTQKMLTSLKEEKGLIKLRVLNNSQVAGFNEYNQQRKNQQDGWVLRQQLETSTAVEETAEHGKIRFSPKITRD